MRRGELSPAAASPRDTLAALGVEPERGLTRAEVEVRRRVHGFNEVREEERRPVREFLAKFWGLSAWMLELIIVLSAALGKYADLIAVSALLVVNAAIGFIQERRAAGVVEGLRQRLQVRARVLREGEWGVVAARELVPGDVVRVRAGDIVPADVKLLSGELRVDQSVLTGESEDIEKASGEGLASGSVVRHGEGTGVVLQTGARTLFGRTAELVRRARPRLHIEDVVAGVVRRLFVVVGSLLAVVLALSLVRGGSLLELLPLMLVLLMSAVPVALPVMFTVSTALGSRRLAARGVLVVRLSAVEDAATMDVLCVDKTGTITMNRLAVTGVLPRGGATESDVLLAGALASQEANQDPIDRAFLAAATERRLLPVAPAPVLVSFAPFDASNRRTEAVVELDGRRLRALKGAVRTIAQACGLAAAEIEALEGRSREFARRGYRTLAVARGGESGPPELLGLVALHDPPRADAGALIAALRDLGVAVKMVTGDALAVASQIGREVGLPEIRRPEELNAEGAELKGVLAADGFAEVYPEDKVQLVVRLQAAGHVAGMTGDGVNDTPALRQAEVGIAVHTATDVARAAASVVLTEPGLTNIVALVEEGRETHQRILTWIINKISETIFKASFVAVAYVVTGRFVISAFAMLLVVFVTDFAKISLAADRARPSRRPETWEIGGFVGVAVVLGAMMVVEALALLAVGWSRFGLAADPHRLHTFSLQLMLSFAVFSILSARERRRFWATMPARPLVVALAADVVLGGALPLVGLPGLSPLSWWQILAVFAYVAVCCLLVNDAVKARMIARFAGG